jgi:hypothetical protein
MKAKSPPIPYTNERAKRAAEAFNDLSISLETLYWLRDCNLLNKNYTDDELRQIAYDCSIRFTDDSVKAAFNALAGYTKPKEVSS